MYKSLLRKLLLVLVISISASYVQAQTVSIKGKVVDSLSQQVLSLVSIKDKDGKIIGTTSEDGSFDVNVPEGTILYFNYVGYRSENLPASAQFMTVMLVGNSEAGKENEVVVTAMGMKKERKALGYSVTELSAKELMKNKNTNVVNSLVGKVPGVNVTQFSGAAGAGASITIRGGNSTSDGRQNQPLFVIDGIIYDNSTNIPGNSATDGMTRSNTTYSNRVMDINPEDIQSLSVLKGAAAAALYGSRAADGVIIITTKKGAEGTASVNIASKVSASWANKLPEVQTEFGNGTYATNGVFNDITYDSWGKKIETDEKVYDNIGNFFKTAMVYDNNVNVSGGNKNGSFFLSGSNFKQTGIIPNTDYDKTTFRFNGDQKYGRLTLSANVAYTIANNKRTLTTSGLYGGGGNGAMGAVYSWPVVFDLTHYLNTDGSQYRPFAGTTALEDDIDNPYWIINKDKLTSETKRITGGINGTFKIASWWDVIARLGYDQYSTNDYTYIAPGSAVIPLYQNGRLSKNLLDYTFITTTVMSNFHKTFGDFDTHLMIGNTTEDTKWLTQNHWGYDFVTAGTISFNNISNENK
ncbi:MAG: SusC/RagA family TonB-linked outer membrane protein, partial [Pseudopedobacter saltans]